MASVSSIIINENSHIKISNQQLLESYMRRQAMAQKFGEISYEDSADYIKENMRVHTHNGTYSADSPEGYEAVTDDAEAVMLRRGGLSKFGETDDDDLVENWLTEAHSHSNQTSFIEGSPQGFLHDEHAYELEI